MATVTRSALHARLCDLLGIRLPICQAGMALIREVRSVRDVIDTTVSEAEAVLSRLSR